MLSLSHVGTFLLGLAVGGFVYSRYRNLWDRIATVENDLIQTIETHVRMIYDHIENKNTPAPPTATK